MRTFLSSVALIFITPFASGVSQGAEVSYSVIDLGTLGGATSSANAINNRGQVVGGAKTAADTSHAFLYECGRMIDLGTLGGLSSRADAINDKGHVVGNFDAGDMHHAFLYSGTNMVDLGTIAGMSTQARGINNSDQVVGFGTVLGQVVHGFLYCGGTIVDLNVVLGGVCSPRGINDLGEIVGQGFGSAAFLYTGGVVTIIGGSGSVGEFVNNKGQAVVYAPPNFNGYIYDHGRRVDLGTLGYVSSYPYCINDIGEVVGMTFVGNVSHAFLSTEGHMVDLNSVAAPGSGLTLSCAFGINSKSQIVGYGTTSGGTNHAFLATPFRKVFIEREGTNMVISWFTNSPTPMRLVQSTNFTLGNWESVAEAAVITNCEYRVRLPVNAASSSWFRLQSQ